VRQAVSTPSAPRQSADLQAIRAGSLLFVSGQIARPGTGQLVDVTSQRRRTASSESRRNPQRRRRPFDNVVGRRSGAERLSGMNEVYATYFNAPAPARATVRPRVCRRRASEIDLIAQCRTTSVRLLSVSRN
jgi:enamine deaminase RidA (YjgF/YER057c/UK114 family)